MCMCGLFMLVCTYVYMGACMCVYVHACMWYMGIQLAIVHLHCCRLRPMTWWADWWSAHPITSVASSPTRPRSPMTGRTTGQPALLCVSYFWGWIRIAIPITSVQYHYSKAVECKYVSHCTTVQHTHIYTCTPHSPYRDVGDVCSCMMDTR